ncbi:predicted protein [Botrytis cinerea T4]|uniref:Uncharacterized protein n=1 Tax=Botryotinia fuckeliana (strain T4) TaxID=999810 RepID=G2YIW7_BOTF4|nr:predicted protein [Botrytis cinerea T4]
MPTASLVLCTDTASARPTETSPLANVNVTNIIPAMLGQKTRFFGPRKPAKYLATPHVQMPQSSTPTAFFA